MDNKKIEEMLNTKDPNKKTAHQIWVDMLVDKLRRVLYPKMNAKNHAFHKSIKEVEKRAEHAVNIAVDYANIRLRVCVDGLIEMLNAIKAQREATDKEFKSTHWIRFKKKRRLLNHAISLDSQQVAYQQALMITVNTLPPPPPEVEVEPAMMTPKALKQFEKLVNGGINSGQSQITLVKGGPNADSK